MENTPNFDTRIGMGIRSILSGDQKASGLLADFAHIGRIVMEITQDKTCLWRQFVDQGWRNLVIGLVGGCELGAQRDPYRSHNAGDMQFPAVDPAMPARLRPMRLCVNRSMRYFPFFAVFFVPDTTLGAQDGAIHGHRSPTIGPGHNQSYQIAPQTTNLGRQALWQ